MTYIVILLVISAISFHSQIPQQELRTNFLNKVRAATLKTQPEFPDDMEFPKNF